MEVCECVCQFSILRRKSWSCLSPLHPPPGIPPAAQLRQFGASLGRVRTDGGVRGAAPPRPLHHNHPQLLLLPRSHNPDHHVSNWNILCFHPLLLETLFQKVNKTHFFVYCITIFSSRRQKRFLGISSRPSFVATIQFAFYNNLSTFQEIVVNRPGITLLIIYNRWWMFL